MEMQIKKNNAQLQHFTRKFIKKRLIHTLIATMRTQNVKVSKN